MKFPRMKKMQHRRMPEMKAQNFREKLRVGKINPAGSLFLH